MLKALLFGPLSTLNVLDQTTGLQHDEWLVADTGMTKCALCDDEGVFMVTLLAQANRDDKVMETLNDWVVRA
jgi:hypothetical protein